MTKSIEADKNPKHDGCQRGLAWIVYKCFDKKLLVVGIKKENISNKELAEVLKKQLLENLENKSYTHLL